MILRLMRLGLPWPLIVFQSVLYASVYLIFLKGMTLNGDATKPLAVTSLLGITPIVWRSLGLNRRATAFELAMPIDTRILFATRIVFLVVCTWLLPICLALSWTVLRHGATASLAVLLLRVAAVITAGGCFLLCFPVRRIATPLWFEISAFCVTALTTAFLVNHGSTAVVLGGSMIASIAFVIVCWLRLPVTFEIISALETAFEPDNLTADSARIRIPWLPAARAFCPVVCLLGLLVMLPLFALEAMLGQWMICSFFAAMTFLNFRPQAPFLLGLPISQRKLLFARTLVVLFAVIVGYSVGLHLRLPRHLSERTESPHIQFASLAVTMAGFFIGVFVCQLVQWRRLSPVPSARRAVFAFLILVSGAIIVAIVPLYSPHAAPFAEAIPLWVAAHLPTNWFALGAVCFTVLAGLYWLIDWQTHELEPVLFGTSRVRPI